MAHLIDLEKVQAVIDERKRMLATKLVGDTESACLARHEYEMAGAMTIWRASEFNRGTQASHIMKALMMSAVASIGGQLIATVRPENRDTVVIGVCTEILEDLMHLIAADPADLGRHSRTVAAEEVGTA